MTTKTISKIVLRYGKEGEHTSSYSTVHKSEEDKFVALYAHSGGYPYATEIENAHDFRTVNAAELYRAGFPGFHIYKITVNYSSQAL